MHHMTKNSKTEHWCHITLYVHMRWPLTLRPAVWYVFSKAMQSGEGLLDGVMEVLSLFHCLHPQHVRNRAVWILLAKVQRRVGMGDKEEALLVDLEWCL